MVRGLLVAFKIPCPPGVLAVGVELVVAGVMELVIASKIPCPAVLAVGVELVVAGVMELVIASKILCPAVVAVGFSVLVVATPKLARVMGVVVKDTTLDKSAGVPSTALGITPT